MYWRSSDGVDGERIIGTEDDDDDEGILPTPEQSVLAEESFEEPNVNPAPSSIV